MSAGYVVDDTALGFAVTDVDGNYAVLAHTVEGTGYSPILLIIPQHTYG
jgi:hypothetical protein